MEALIGPVAAAIITAYGPMGLTIVAIIGWLLAEIARRKGLEKYIERTKELRDRIDAIQEKRIGDNQEALKATLGTASAISALTEIIKERRRA